MTILRRHLSWLLGLWLVCQIAGILTPVALAAAGYTAAEEFCDCPDEGHGATCPMHHGKIPRGTSSSSQGCHLQNTCAPTDAALLSMFSGTGLIPAETVISLTVTSQPVVLVTPAIVHHLDVPDSPPPRR